MTNRQAKKILTFLARKIGYDGISYKVIKNGSYWLGVCNSFYEHIPISAYGSKNNHSELIIMRCLGDELALQEFLEKSQKGYAIVNNRKNIMVPAYCTLEQILVEMDLEPT